MAPSRRLCAKCTLRLLIHCSTEHQLGFCVIPVTFKSLTKAIAPNSVSVALLAVAANLQQLTQVPKQSIGSATAVQHHLATGLIDQACQSQAQSAQLITKLQVTRSQMSQRRKHSTFQAAPFTHLL